MIIWATDICNKVLIDLSHVFYDPLAVNNMVDVWDEIRGQGLVPLALEIWIINVANGVVELVVAGYHDKSIEVGYSILVIHFLLGLLALDFFESPRCGIYVKGCRSLSLISIIPIWPRRFRYRLLLFIHRALSCKTLSLFRLILLRSRKLIKVLRYYHHELGYGLF